MRRWPLRCVALLGLAAGGCAPLVCEPVTIVVADREERSRLREEVVGIRTTETGRNEEMRRTVSVPEYWVRASDGRSYRVSHEQHRAAVPGQPLQVCR